MKHICFWTAITLTICTTVKAEDYWEKLNLSPTGVIQAIIVDSSGHVFVGSTKGEIYRSTDDGNSWFLVHNINSSIYCFVINAQGEIFAATRGEGVIFSANSGNNWEQRNNGLSNPYVTSLAINSVGYIFAGTYNPSTQQGGMFRSIDNGNSWAEISSGLIETEVHDIAINSYDYIFAGTINSIYISLDNGENWSQMVSGLHDVSSLVINSSGYIFVGTWDGGILRSTDFGNTWSEINNGLQNINISSLTINSSGQLFAGTWKSGVYTSLNNGSNWREINDGLTSNIIRTVALDENEKLYAGAGFTTSDGVFQSKNSTVKYKGLLGERFSTFVERIDNAPYLDRSSIVDSFLNAETFPMIEHSAVAYFIYEGSATTVAVPGDANDWEYNQFQMTRLSSTDLWYYEAVFEQDARLDYKFVVDGSTWILDPLNPHQVSGGFGPNSELAMPDYIQPAEITNNSTIAHGNLNSISVTSSILGNSRTVQIYTPPGYDANSKTEFPLLLFHDGLEYTTLGSALNILDNLIAEKLITPVIAVFVPPVNRDSEYAFTQTREFEYFIINELLPIIDSQYRTLKEPENRGMIGPSWGGLISAQICFNHPETFGLAGLFSPSFWPNNMFVYNQVLYEEMKTIKWYIDWGTYERSIKFNANAFKNGLESKGYELTWNEWHEGHSWGSWRAHLDNALTYLFPSGPTAISNENKPMNSTLLQNYPNPCNPSTTITFSTPVSEFISLKVYDVLGNEIATLVSEEKLAGTYKIKFDGTNLSSGVYFYRMESGGFTSTKKLILMK